MQLIPQILGLLTILGQVFVGVSIIYLLLGSKDCRWAAVLKDNILQLAFVVALLALTGSLFFSEIMQLDPCRLCWFQRIFMYPQAVILAVALWRKDLTVRLYSLALSSIGILFSIYHYYIQNFNVPTTCSLNAAESCATVTLRIYGYITIPMMAMTAFAMLIVLWTVYYKKLVNNK